MKRSQLQRRTPLARTGSIRKRNAPRSAKMDARNFGEEAERVRGMACLVYTASVDHWARTGENTNPGCMGDSQAAHATPRGMGGCNSTRWSLVPFCAHHHDEAGEAGTSQRADFEKRHRLDVLAEADRIALKHPRPLGTRGLADRWVLDNAWAKTEHPLADFETDALLGLVHREMVREVARRAADYIVGDPPTLDEIGRRRDYARDSVSLMIAVSNALGIERDQALALCEQAAERFGGWP